MFKVSIICIGVLFGILLGARPCAAIEDLKVFRGVLVLEGYIFAGDYAKVRAFLSNESNFKKISGGVFLASPGGNAREAMQIGILIRQLRLTTIAPAAPQSERRAFSDVVISAPDLVHPKDYVCASACFLIYVAGIDRKLAWGGRLGVHQPQIQSKPLGISEDDVTIAKAGMLALIKRYFETMDVPDKYVDLMYSVPPNELRWISHDEFESDLKGYVPEVTRLLNTKCNPLPSQIKIDLNGSPPIILAVGAGKPSATQSNEILNCLSRLKTQLPIEAWQKVFRPG
jgi:hypothetical protein